MQTEKIEQHKWAWEEVMAPWNLVFWRPHRKQYQLLEQEDAIGIQGRKAELLNKGQG